MDTNSRVPYEGTGTGEGGAWRRARLDRERARGLAWSDPRQSVLLDSAARWEALAWEYVLARVGDRPSMEQVEADESWEPSPRAALELLRLSPVVRSEAARHTEWGAGGRWTYPDGQQLLWPWPWLDWDAFAARVDEMAGCWSSTEARLARIVAALATGRSVALADLAGAGSWQADVLDVLVRWASQDALQVTGRGVGPVRNTKGDTACGC